MKYYLLVLSTGFALFSMFFGSGNLVFPISVGYESEGHYLLAALGIVLTGVIVPFGGVFGMMLFEGDLNRFFRFFGPKGTFLFSFLALALMGPFGVLARCLTVAHGATQQIFPAATLTMSSLTMCGVIFLLVFHKNKILSLLGHVLTPFLLLSIAAIVFFGITQGSIDAPASLDQLKAFKNGFFQGYQTMDLLAAFFFSQFVINQLMKSMPTGDGKKATLQLFFKASLIGGGLLAMVYCALVVLGWIYAPLLLNKPPEEMLGIIAMESLGSMAAPCVCVAIIFACLTTAIVLTSLFADFIRHEVSKGLLNNTAAILITLTIGFFVSTLEFSGIAAFLGPLLEAVYPALIALTAINIASLFIKLQIFINQQSLCKSRTCKGIQIIGWQAYTEALCYSHFTKKRSLHFLCAPWVLFPAGIAGKSLRAIKICLHQK